MRRRRLAIAPLQDPRVRSLLGLPQKEMLRTIRFVTSDGCQHSGADALVAVAGELWWAAPLVWACRLPGGMAGLRRAYQWVAERRRCQAQRSPVCMVDSTPILEEERL
jgi:hypothetical protein